MSAHATVSASRWLIGVELRLARTAIGVDLPVAAGASLLNCASSKISHMEAGRYKQSPDEVAKLLNFYGAPATTVDRLVALAAREDESTWWAPWSDVVPDWLQTFVGLERLADTEVVYEQATVPGLLQTEEYAAVLTEASRRVRADRAARLVGFRIARQKRLEADVERPLELIALVEEAGLRRPVGSAEVRRRQYEHLLEMTERPNVSIRVLPTSLATHAALAGRFVLLQFTEVRSIAYVELQDGAVYLERPDEVATYTMTAESLVRDALGRDESRSLITSLIAELR